MLHHILKMKNKNHRIISIYAEKAFEKNLIFIYDKSSPEKCHKGNIPQHNKAIGDQHTPNIIFM